MINLNSKVLKGSLLLLVAFNIYNLLNFVFQAVMARMLGLAEFSIYGPLSALIYLLAIITESSQTVLAKYSSKEDSIGKVKNLLKRAIRRSLSAALLLFIGFVIVSFPLSGLLRIPLPLMFLTGFLIFTSFLIPTGRGILQGKQRFFSLGFNMVSESVVKIGLGVFFVVLGWKVYGVIAAIVLSVLMSFLLSLISLRTILKQKETRAQVPHLYAYSLPTFVALLGITSFYVVDLLIARAVFPDETAGLYAIIALLGKAIFWGTQPISKALFPISASSAQQKNSKKSEFWTAFLLLSICAVVALAVFWAIPGFILHLLSGSSQVLAHDVLFVVGLAFGILSVANLIILYKLSLGKTEGYWLLILPVLVEAIFLALFHASLEQFSYALLGSSIVFVIVVVLSLRK